MASDARPAVLATVRPTVLAALLVNVGLVTALVCDPRMARAPVAMIHMPPRVVVPMNIQPPSVFGALGDLLTPPAHPDARPWPHGMVITPPDTPDAIQLRFPNALDSLLSALLAPWLAIAS